MKDRIDVLRGRRESERYVRGVWVCVSLLSVFLCAATAHDSNSKKWRRKHTVGHPFGSWKQWEWGSRKKDEKERVRTESKWRRREGETRDRKGLSSEREKEKGNPWNEKKNCCWSVSFCPSVPLLCVTLSLSLLRWPNISICCPHSTTTGVPVHRTWKSGRRKGRVSLSFPIEGSRRHQEQKRHETWIGREKRTVHCMSSRMDGEAETAAACCVSCCERNVHRKPISYLLASSFSSCDWNPLQNHLICSHW